MFYRISKKRLLSLLESEAMLNQLEAYGVDNWGGYGMLNEDDPDWDAYDEAVENIKSFERI